MVLVAKNPPANTEDIRIKVSIPRSRRSPGGGHSNPLQYSCLENPTDRGAWRAYSPGSGQESDRPERVTLSLFFMYVWPKYCSFSFNISPFNEYPELISLRMDWLDLLAVQGTLKSLLQHHSSKASILRHSAFFTGRQ